MLHKITIENFFSVADEQSIALSIPQKSPDLACFRHSRSDSDTRLPVAVGFFGPNASGKSTILRAIVSAALFACYSFEWANERAHCLFQAYRQQAWWDKPTKILVEFDCQLSDASPSVIFRYELHIALAIDNLTNKAVSYEALSYAPKGKFRRLFERVQQNFYFGPEWGIANSHDTRKDSIRPNASVISTLAQLNHPLAIYIRQQLKEIQTNIVGVLNIQQDANQWLSTYADNPACLDRLNKDLRRFDVGLESMTVERSNQGLIAKFKHVGLDAPIYLPEESAGTRRFIEIFPYLHNALEKGRVAVIDELDTAFHPLLMPELFRWFGDQTRNPHGAQLFFTAHNPALLDSLEKEQIFFTEKPSGQASQVYGVRDIKGLRREPSLMKKYLMGELGAIPHIG